MSTTYFNTAYFPPRQQVNKPPIPPSATAIYVGQPLLLQAGTAPVWTPGPDNALGSIALPSPNWDPNNNPVSGSINIQISQQDAQSLGNWLATIGYGPYGNTIGLFTNGVASSGFGIAAPLRDVTSSQGFANSFVYIINNLTTLQNADQFDDDAWITALFIASVAIGAVASGGGEMVGLGVGGALGMLGGMSSADGSTPVASFSGSDSDADWLLGDDITAQFAGGGSCSYANAWSSFFP